MSDLAETAFRRHYRQVFRYGHGVAAALRDAIAALPESQRRVVVMKLLEGRSFAEIAARLGASEAACKMRLSRALERLRDELAPWSGHGPSPVARALAAIGPQPVIHAVVEFRRPSDVVVDLATGREHERVEQTEYWYDRDRSLLRTRLTVDGVFITEAVESRSGLETDVGHFAGGGVAPRLDPALAGFATRYREALADGSAKVVGHATVDGRNATVIRISVPDGGSEDVDVDSDTYRPLSFTYTTPDGKSSSSWRVVEIESIPGDPSLFRPPQLSPPRPTEGETGGGRVVTAAEAATALGRPALWAGERLGDLALAELRLEHGRTRWTDGRRGEARVLELRYGRRRAGDWVQIGEATSVDGAFAIGVSGVAGGFPVPPEGSIAVTGVPGVSHFWRGELRVGDVYVSLMSTSRELLMAAARSLRPLG